MTTLAERADACPGWRLMPQMAMRAVMFPAARAIVLAVTDTHVLLADPAPRRWDQPRIDPMLRRGPDGSALSDHWVPDFDNAATLGLTTKLVREAWGPEHSVLVRLDEGSASVSIGNEYGWIYEFGSASLGLPLIDALEAAPR